MMTHLDTISGVDARIWRLRLLARLAAERASLLRQLRGIDEETLSTTLLENNWTVKDILAHIGSWDAFHSERMSMVLNGRINAIAELGGQGAIDSRNAEIHLFSQTLTLEQALAICLKERGGFLATLARIPDDLLHRSLVMPWSWQTQMREWAEWRYRHDAVHAGQIRAWRKQLPPEDKRRIGPVYLLRALLKATRKEFVTLADLVAANERETKPVCGIWSLKDLTGHLADWEQVGLDGLRQLAAGQSPEFEERIDDFDVWNKAHAAARQEQPWDEMWKDFQETRRQLMRLVDEMPAEGWERPFTTPWNTQLNGYQWTLIWTEHEHEHAADLRGAVDDW